MKKIMFLILLLANYCAFSQVNYSTVDDFNRTDNYTMGTTSSGNSTWTENEESGHPEQLQIASNVLLAITGGVSGLEPTNASIDLTNEVSGFDLGNGTYGWSFHFHLYRNPSGWGSSNYSLGWVLVGNENDFSSSTVDGWAVLWTATNDELVLGYFTDGISGTNPLTNVVQTGLDWDNSGSDGVNVRIEVDASGNWTFYWELGPAISVPTDIDANSATSSSADNTFFDDVNMKYSGPIWAHSTSSSSTSKGDFDNFNFGETVSGGVDNPTNFTAVTAGTDQIDLSWTQNASGNDVMVAYTTDGTFGTPVDGT
ncbi:MAG: hypothetical protein GXO86_14320, partial [Chlorobi bacterium]|nr:hypothetical protein [Chlorobiota bacterium]